MHSIHQGNKIQLLHYWTIHSTGEQHDDSPLIPPAAASETTGAGPTTAAAAATAVPRLRCHAAPSPCPRRTGQQGDVPASTAAPDP